MAGCRRTPEQSREPLEGGARDIWEIVMLIMIPTLNVM